MVQPVRKRTLGQKKEAFPRERRFREIPGQSLQFVKQPQLRRPWATMVQLYRAVIGPQYRTPFHALAHGVGVMTDTIIDSGYRLTRLITMGIHLAIALYAVLYWSFFSSRETSLFSRWSNRVEWSSDGGEDINLDEVPSDPHGVFSYRGGASQNEFKLVATILRRATRQKLGESESHTLTEAIVNESTNHAVDPAFVATVVKHESGFRRAVVSSAGAVGLMQLLPSTGQFVCTMHRTPWGGTKKLCSPAYNIKLGIRYLRYLLHQFPHNLYHVLIAYNWGPGNLQRAIKKGRAIPRGPISYARSILREYEGARRMTAREWGSGMGANLRHEGKKVAAHPGAAVKVRERVSRPERKIREGLVF